MEIRNIMMTVNETGLVIGMSEYYTEEHPSKTKKKRLYTIDIRDCVRYGEECLYVNDEDVERKRVELENRLCQGFVEFDYVMIVREDSFISTSKRWMELYAENYESVSYGEWMIKKLLE
jgi:hypothetical protein